MAQPIDFSKRFMPEALTPLWHTPIFAEFSPSQRRRYNQLQAAYFNEQIIFFESAMAHHILSGLLRTNLPAALLKAIQTFREEERLHSQMFRDLNHRCFPERYESNNFFFVQIGEFANSALRWWASYPTMFPMFLWILLIQEERALFCAKQFLAEAENLEPSFVAAQRQHLADEVGHVGWDEELLDLIWKSKTPRARRINAAIFQWMMGEYFTTPKRSGLRVLRELVREDPSLEPLWPEMSRQMLDLSHSGAFRFISYSREVTAKSFARFDRWPEFRSLGKVLAGYAPANSELAGA
jgi:hypothetical protein